MRSEASVQRMNRRVRAGCDQSCFVATDSVPLNGIVPIDMYTLDRYTGSQCGTFEVQPPSTRSASGQLEASIVLQLSGQSRCGVLTGFFGGLALCMCHFRSFHVRMGR